MRHMLSIMLLEVKWTSREEKRGSTLIFFMYASCVRIIMRVAQATHFAFSNSLPTSNMTWPKVVGILQLAFQWLLMQQWVLVVVALALEFLVFFFGGVVVGFVISLIIVCGVCCCMFVWRVLPTWQVLWVCMQLFFLAVVPICLITWQGR